jgi:hypothetical protein
LVSSSHCVSICTWEAASDCENGTHHQTDANSPKSQGSLTNSPCKDLIVFGQIRPTFQHRKPLNAVGDQLPKRIAGRRMVAASRGRSFENCKCKSIGHRPIGLRHVKPVHRDPTYDSEAQNWMCSNSKPISSAAHSV